MNEEQRLEEGIAALQAQRALLGDSVVDIATAPLRARLEALRAERAAPAAPAQTLKQVTVLFVDIVGSTQLGQRLDPEDLHAVFDGALQRFTALVEQQHGRVLQYAGDGLLAAFGADEAREDDAECAVRAGLAIIDEARLRATRLQQAYGAEAIEGFNVRVGAHTGPVLLGGGVDAEGTIRGSVVSLAARMEQLAPPGGLRIHHDTYRHVRGVFNVTAEPPLFVKGSEEPQQTYLVHSAKPRAFRVVTRGIEGVESRMVAREAELEALQDVFHTLFAQPRLYIAHVVGEAGLGKSRLVYEFENWAESQPSRFTWFRGRAEPLMRQQAFGLLRNLFAWRLEIAEDDDAETARRKLCDGIVPLFGDDPELGLAQAHLLGHLIGLDFASSPHVRGIVDDARQLRNRGFHAAAQVLLQTGRHFDAPPLMLLDDLHWADDGSLDFLSYLAQVQRDEPMLLVCMTRQTLFERRNDWELVAAAHTRIELQPLDKRGARELAGVLLQRLQTVPAALRELVIAGAEGNPFHMEELVRMLIDSGAIDTEGERWQVRAERLLAAQVPATLTGVLQARLDSLPAAEKLALQQAAVVGYVFWDDALAALDAAAPAALPALVRRGLVMPRQHATYEGQKEYTFKHLALQQVTYESVLKRQRRVLHGQLAQWFLRLGGDRSAETLGPAAEHFERAGELDQACTHYLRAAEAAAARSADDALLGYVARALPLSTAEAGAETRWQLLSLREPVLLAQGDRQAHEADLQALEALAEQCDNDAWRAGVALRRGAAHRSTGDYVAAEAADRRGLALVNSLPQGPARRMLSVAPYHGLAASLIGQGRYANAREVAEAGLQLAHTLHDRRSESHLVNALGLIAMEQGDLAVAVAHFESGLAMVREMGNRGDEALRLSNLGSVYPRLGDYPRARSCLELGLQVARAVGRRHDEAALLLNTASVAHLQGDDTAALGFARAAFDSAVASGQRDLEAFALLVAGHAELGLGRLDAAREAYTASRDRLQALNLRAQQVLDPVSGLARVALAAGDVPGALAQVELLLAHQAAGGSFDGTEEPLLLPLTCWRVLQAAGDARADAVLAAAMAELRKQAERINDEAARQDFLNRVPHHCEIVQAWQARQSRLLMSTAA
jgi:class 3 adenylate cyclase/tetratricopeptide (TPR) repeat protein